MKDYLLIIVMLVACIILIPFMSINLYVKILAEGGSIFCLFVLFSVIAEKKEKEKDDQ